MLDITLVLVTWWSQNKSKYKNEMIQNDMVNLYEREISSDEELLKKWGLTFTFYSTIMKDIQ